MAKVFSPPEEIKAPDHSDMYTAGNFDMDKYQKAEQEYTDKVIKFCKDTSACPHAGDKIRFPVADGYAQYIVYDYTTLILLELGDSYQIPDAHARGLRKADIIKQAESLKALNQLFARQ